MRLIFKGEFNPLNNLQLEQIKILMTKNKFKICYLLNNDKDNFLFDISIKDYSFIYKISEAEILDEDKVIKLSKSYNISYLKGDFREYNQTTRDFIFNNNWIIEKIIKDRMSSRRFAHTLSVATTSKQIAQANNLDQDKAYLAGLLHDYCKELDRDKEKEIMKKRFDSFLHLPRAIFHQFTAYYLLKENLCLTDSDILDAVGNHVAGTSYKPYAMVIYIADKIEPLRKYDVEYETKLYKKNLKACFEVVKAKQAKYLEENK